MSRAKGHQGQPGGAGFELRPAGFGPGDPFRKNDDGITGLERFQARREKGVVIHPPVRFEAADHWNGADAAHEPSEQRNVEQGGLGHETDSERGGKKEHEQRVDQRVGVVGREDHRAFAREVFDPLDGHLPEKGADHEPGELSQHGLNLRVSLSAAGCGADGGR